MHPDGKSTLTSVSKWNSGKVNSTFKNTNSHENVFENLGCARIRAGKLPTSNIHDNLSRGSTCYKEVIREITK